MKKTGLVFTTILATAAVGCQRNDSAIVEKLDEVKNELTAIKEQLAKGGPVGARQPARRPRPRPNPNDVFAVDVSGAPIHGSDKAKVTVVKAFEFACPFCERARPTMDQLIKDYGNDVRIAYKHYVVHPQSATVPAQAACAAHQQGKFKKMYDLIWDKGFKASRNLGKDNMEALAKEAGLNVTKFKADMEGACAAQIRKDQAQMAQLGVTGTPAFYINGRFLSGARPVDQFKRVIDEELKKANERIQKGEATAANYYEKFVVEKGKKKFAPPAN